MLCINNTSTDAYFNLASEEYLLKNSSEDIFMLWQNQPSVIIGKHQNAWAEINVDFANQHKMNIIRRYTGGGAVYHDSGNVNLSFIEHNTNPDFDIFTNTIIDMLSTLGITATADSRRGLKINGLKISGSAQCIHQGKILHHATLLFSSDLSKLITVLDSKYVPATDEKQKSKVYVKSVKSAVTNIEDHLAKMMSLEEFKQKIIDYILTHREGSAMHSFSETDIATINLLKEKKYIHDIWNFDGIAPK